MSEPTLLSELASAVKYLLETGARGGLDKATLETYAGRLEKALTAFQAQNAAEAAVRFEASTSISPAPKAVEAPPVGAKPAITGTMPSSSAGTISPTATAPAPPKPLVK